jgi:hypothetical protein
MIENILLYAAYYETMAKFSGLHVNNKCAKNIAENAVNSFYISAKESASQEDINELGKILYKNVLASFQHGGGFKDTNMDNNPADNDGIKAEIIEELAANLTDSIIKDLDI